MTQTDIKQPNILFILADDMGAWALGSAGNTEVQTPHLDRLAAQGVRYENFYCASPVCSAARASILTGLMPSGHGVYDWIAGGSLNRHELPAPLCQDPRFALEEERIQYLEGFDSYTDLLHRAGYQVHLSGKWHLGDSLSAQKSFDHWFTIGRGGCLYTQPDIVENGELKIVDRYLTDLITEDALKVLESAQKSAAPFYLSVHYTAPHTPWDQSEHPQDIWDLYSSCPFTSAPAEPVHPWQIPSCDQPFEPGPHLRQLAASGDAKALASVARYEDERKRLLRGYYTAITAMDCGIGRLLDQLEALNLSDHTMVVFLGDNGMNLGHHGIWGKGNGTFPLNLYETSVKVPCILKLPEIMTNHLEVKGRSIRDIHSQLDFFQTFAQIAQAASQDGCDTLRPGKSLLASLPQELAHAGEAVDLRGEAIVVDEYGPNRMIRRGRYKLVRRYPYGPDELFDLLEDPDETANLLDQPEYQKLRGELEQALHLWCDRYMDPEMDGTREGVTGCGQLRRGGKYGAGKRYVKQDAMWSKGCDNLHNPFNPKG